MNSFQRHKDEGAASDRGPLSHCEPASGCRRCPRLVKLRRDLRGEHPDWWNAPVPAFGDPAAHLAIVGLAPGREGANRTGRPFTGDASGQMLFDTLDRYGFLNGRFDNRSDDGVALNGAIILNAVKCLPPGNRPTGEEIRNCQSFLRKSLVALPRLRTVLALGKIAHDAVLRVYDLKLANHKFAHGSVHELPGAVRLIDSYHCSRYNVNTGRLTDAMFEQVFEMASRSR